MRAAVWRGIGELAFDGDWPDPKPSPDEVLVKVVACGVCGSDSHIVEGHFEAGSPPQVIGHEVAGEIVEVGDQVRDWSPGDRVACNLFGYCGACPWCLAGQPNLCRRKYFSASGFAEYASFRSEQLFLLPDDVSLTVGAFLEPVAACMHAVDTGAVRSGEHVLVIGAGPMGQIIAQLCHLSGAQVTISDPRPRGREVADVIGMARPIDPTEVDVVALARQTGPRRGFDVVFEAAGAPAALAASPSYASGGGRVVVVGVFDEEVEVAYKPFLLYEREISIQGSFAAKRDFPRSLEMLRRLRLEPLVTLSAPLEDAAEVYRSHRAGEQLKVQFRP